MKLRTSFFDKTVLGKDITRFAPVWGLYLIGGLIFALSLAGNSSRAYGLAQDMNNYIGPFGIISLCYAIVTAQMLFGDLFNSRLCNALHALPLRREGWFLTHYLAGFLFSFVPNLICALVVMPFLGQFWYTSFLWLLGMTLHYVFFFSLAVFCMLLTGNRFAAVAVYAIVNFLSMIAMWFATILYEPLMYGIDIRTDGFAPFCPVADLFQRQDYFSIDHRPDCWCKNYPIDPSWMESTDSHDYYFAGMGGDWWYVIILFVLGIALAAAALQLYRKRHLESAGDFISFPGAKPVFSLLYTLSVGVVLAAMEDLLNIPYFILLFIGLVIGYFTGQMLLQRNLRVFKKKNWLAIVLIFALLLGSMGLVQADTFGIESWVPEENDVISVKIANQRVSEFNSYNTDAELTEPAHIQKILTAHGLLIAEGPTEERSGDAKWSNVTLCYKLKNGREVYRTYKANTGGPGIEILNEMIFNNPVYVLRADSLERLQSKVDSLRVEGILMQGEKKDRLLESLWLDAQEGTLQLQQEYFDKYDEYLGYMELYYGDGYNLYLDIYSSSRHTAQVLMISLMEGISPSDLASSLSRVRIGYATLDWDDPLDAFCEGFCKELGPDGSIYKRDMMLDQQNAIPIVLYLHSGTTLEYYTIEGSPFALWVKENFPHALDGM